MLEAAVNQEKYERRLSEVKRDMAVAIANEHASNFLSKIEASLAEADFTIGTDQHDEESLLRLICQVCKERRLYRDRLKVVENALSDRMVDYDKLVASHAAEVRRKELRKLRMKKAKVAK